MKINDNPILNWDELPKEPTVAIFDPEGKCVAITDSMLEFDWIRAQIKKANQDGWTIMKCGTDDDTRYPIYPCGGLSSDILGKFSLPGDQWMEVVEELL